MKYIEVILTINPIEPLRDMLVYALGDEGPYDSFEETSMGLKAYVPAVQYDEAFLQQTIEENLLDPAMQVSYTVQEMPDKDWNAEWEKSYPAVLVEGFCWVRSPFHEPRHDVPYEVIIEPKMSFGTAHHATTYMMLSHLRRLALQDATVLDMGSGTAVLAILAAKLGAARVDAVDVDEWAYRNALENVAKNGVEYTVHCCLGDASALPAAPTYNVVLANINRNILLRDMPVYVAAMKPGATILFSGFYEQDVEALRACAEPLGLVQQDRLVRQDWASLRFVKQ